VRDRARRGRGILDRRLADKGERLGVCERRRREQDRVDDGEDRCAGGDRERQREHGRGRAGGGPPNAPDEVEEVQHHRRSLRLLVDAKYFVLDSSNMTVAKAPLWLLFAASILVPFAMMAIGFRLFYDSVLPEV